MRKEMEEIREKVHTTADAALFLCFQELNGSHSKGVIRGNAASDEPDL